MQHTDAVRTGAAERYLLGELTVQQALEYEEHFFDCPECAEEVRSAVALADNAREAFRTEAPGPSVRPRSRPPRGLRMALLWPAGAAAALMLAAYQALVVVPGLRHEVAQGDTLQAAPWFFLSVSRAEPQVLTLAPGQRMVGLTLSRSPERPSPYYRCHVVDSTGRVLESAILPGPRGGEELQLLLPVSRFRPGTYAIELAALQAPGGPVLDRDLVRYQFELRRQEEKK